MASILQASLAAFLLLPMATTMHSDCIFKKEQAMCLEKIQRANDLMGLNDSSPGCPGMWDNLTCWKPAHVGEMVLVSCPEFFRIFNPDQMWKLETFGEFDFPDSNSLDLSDIRVVSRNCTEDGWSEPFPHYVDACGFDDYDEYESGDQDYYYLSVKALYTVGYSTSLVTLTTAMVILCRFRKLHCTRNFIHMNLFVSFMLRAISVFIKDWILYAEQDSNHCFISTVECKAIMVFFHYCVVSNYFWLFIEGLYLFTLLVETFFPERRYFYWYTIIGWGTPTVCVSVWAMLRLYFDDTGCWDMNDNTALWWVIKGPVVGSIMVNFVLFIGIIVILVQKLQSPDMGGNESSIYFSCVQKCYCKPQRAQQHSCKMSELSTITLNLLSVSPQPGTSWPGKLTDKGSTKSIFKDPESERGQPPRGHLGSGWDILPSFWRQLWSRAPGSCRTGCLWPGVEGSGICTHGASCLRGSAFVHLKVFPGYPSPFLCVSFSTSLFSLSSLSFLLSQLGSQGPHADPMDSPPEIWSPHIQQNIFSQKD